MSFRTARMAALALIGAAVLAGIVLYPLMPALMASHWNAQGQVDGYLPKLLALFALPLGMVIVWLLFEAIPQIDPLRANLQKFIRYYAAFAVALLALLLYLHALMLLWNLGIQIDLLRSWAPAGGLLVFLSGVLMEHAEPNWFVGIRTPWTLSSPTVWAETHRRGALAFKLAGVVGALGVLLPSFWALVFLMVPLAVASAYALIFSYVAYQREQRP